jgi:hypothetical protein
VAKSTNSVFIHVIQPEPPFTFCSLVFGEFCKPLKREVPLTMKKFALYRFNSKQPPETDFINFEDFIGQTLNSDEVPNPQN